MRIAASLRNASGTHAVSVSTADTLRRLEVPAKASGGSAVNGGEFLMLALATCYCNDLYREAARLGIPVEAVEVEASAEFSGIGLAASDIRYRARVQSSVPRARIDQLLRETDAVAEVHNTLRVPTAVALVPWEPS